MSADPYTGVLTAAYTDYCTRYVTAFCKVIILPVGVPIRIIAEYSILEICDYMDEAFGKWERHESRWSIWTGPYRPIYLRPPFTTWKSDDDHSFICSNGGTLDNLLALVNNEPRIRRLDETSLMAHRWDSGSLLIGYPGADSEYAIETVRSTASHPHITKKYVDMRQSDPSLIADELRLDIVTSCGSYTAAICDELLRI